MQLEVFAFLDFSGVLIGVVLISVTAFETNEKVFIHGIP